MNARVCKDILILVLILLTGVVFPITNAYAQPLDMDTLCTGLDVDGEAGPNPLEGTVEHISLLQIVCPFARLFNIALYSAGIVFVIMLVYGGIKLSLAGGDPKAMQAVKGTWTWAVIGFGVVIGFIAILSIVAGMFGLNIDVLNPFGYIAEAIGAFLCNLGVSSTSYPCT